MSFSRYAPVVIVIVPLESLSWIPSHTHTHARIHIYIYVSSNIVAPSENITPIIVTRFSSGYLERVMAIFARRNFITDG